LIVDILADDIDCQEKCRKWLHM